MCGESATFDVDTLWAVVLMTRKTLHVELVEAGNFCLVTAVCRLEGGCIVRPKAFKEGREEVADEPRSGRPTTARTDEDVDRVLEVLRTDRRLSIQQIADTLHMSTFVVHGIVTEYLQMRKNLRVLRCQELLDLIQNEPDFLNSVVTGDESWMFEYDPESKRQRCAWHTKSSLRPKKARMSNSRIKTMIIVFFDIRGIVHCEFVPQGQTVNSDFYLEVLRRLKRRIARVRTDIKDTVKLHHDNATSHTDFIITNFLAQSNTPVIPHPPYSPDLAPSYGDAVMSRRRVFEWYKRFKEGREETADNERSGRPSTSTTPEKVNKVLELVDSIDNQDILGVRRLNAVLVPKDLTLDQKNAQKETASLNLEATTDDPELLKRVITGDETWIYGFDSETTQQASECRFKNEQRPKKARKAPSKIKVMFTVFFDYQGIVHHEFQQQGSTITADSYLGVLRRLREAIRQKRPELWRSKSWILHHDNAPAHAALKISKFLQDHSTSVFPQPPYSPDLAPCDFFLFGKLKKSLRVGNFTA
ncbi:hypothetical protein LAZ67_3004611 [Cordylochernes scorpioides]|uniref:Transposase n=1 Tax=Cordylochernes scorpioides TaxID=51811 RepID=A0ABY6K9M0_9ARAC|nr:hypothetical protein LAZ67_3004611 [Cordylochernes scorpioides]